MVIHDSNARTIRLTQTPYASAQSEGSSESMLGGGYPIGWGTADGQHWGSTVAASEDTTEVAQSIPRIKSKSCCHEYREEWNGCINKDLGG